jgi:AbrB family looped-hinge helix DNA binding protein
MPRATVTSKGQITIPRLVRERLGIESGDALDFAFEGADEVRMRKLSLSARDLRGILKKPGRRARTIAEMKRAVRARGAALG